MEYVKALLGRRDLVNESYRAHQCETLETLQDRAKELFTVAQRTAEARFASGSKVITVEQDIPLYAVHMDVEVLYQRVTDSDVRRLVDTYSTAAYAHGSQVSREEADASHDKLLDLFTTANLRIGSVLRDLRAGKKR